MVHGLYPCHMFGVHLKNKSETENLKENGPTLGTCQEQMIILFGGTQVSSRPQSISVDNIISKMSNSQSKTHIGSEGGPAETMESRIKASKTS